MRSMIHQLRTRVRAEWPRSLRAVLVAVALLGVSAALPRTAKAQGCAVLTFSIDNCTQPDAHVSQGGYLTFTVADYDYVDHSFTVLPYCTGVVQCSQQSFYLSAGASMTITEPYSVSAQSGSGVADVMVEADDGSELEVTQTVYAQPAFTIDSSQTAVYGADERVGLCAAACFTASSAVSTVPFYTLGQARGVTLVYNEERAHPKPFIYAAVTPAQDAATVSKYYFSATLNGSPVTFTNGEQRLTFLSPGNVPVRLGGQVSLPGGLDAKDLQVTVVAKYPNGDSASMSYASKLLVYDASGSSVARGWHIANINKLDCEWTPHWGGCIIYQGDGSMELLRGSFPSYVAADHSTLTYNSSTGRYERKFLDGSEDQYDGNGFLVARTDPLGRATTFSYSSAGQLVKIADPRRNANQPVPYDTLIYDANGLHAIIEQGGSGAARTTTVVVDNNRNLSSVTNPDGTAFHAYYYGNNYLYATANDLGTTYYNPDASGKLGSVNAASVAVDQGNGATTSESPTTYFTPWQSIGVPTTTTANTPPTAARLSDIWAVIQEPGGRVTQFQVNDYGQPTATIDPSNAQTTVAYAGKNPVSILHPDYSTDTLVYDTLDRVVMSQAAMDSPVNFHYNAASQVDSVWGQGVVATGYHYASDRTLQTMNDASGVWMDYSYNANKQLISTTDNAYHTTYYGYDRVFANQDSVTIPSGQRTTLVFDAYGRDSVEQVPSLAAVTTVYDVMNRPVQVTQTGRPATVVGYNSLFRTDVTDAKGNNTHTDFNALGWPVARRDASGIVDSMYYDVAGRVTTWKNRRGDRMQYTYDPLGRLKSRTGRNIADHYSYDDGPNATTVVAWNSIETDSTFYVTSAFRRGAGDSTVTWINGVRYRVLHGHMGSLNMNDSTAISALHGPGLSFRNRYTYYPSTGSGAGQPSQVQDGFNTATVGYTNEGLVTNVYSPVFGNRVTRYTNLHEPFVLSFDQASLLPAFRRYYHYDGTGRLDQLIFPDAGNTQLFGYTPYGELGSVTTKSGCTLTANDSTAGAIESCPTTNGTVTFPYDSVGNRKDFGATYYAGNRLALFNGGWNTYDADGNLHQKYLIPPNPHNQIFSWNPENRLDTVSTDGYYTVVYKYNALGQPVLKYRQGVLDRVWIWDGDQLLLETDGSNQRVGETSTLGWTRPMRWSRGTRRPPRSSTPSRTPWGTCWARTPVLLRRRRSATTPGGTRPRAAR